MTAEDDEEQMTHRNSHGAILQGFKRAAFQAENESSNLSGVTSGPVV